MRNLITLAIISVATAASASISPTQVPDAGSTALLMTLSVGAVMAARRIFARR